METLIIHDGYKCAYLGEDREIEIILSVSEYRALLCLAEANGYVVKTDELIEQIYDADQVYYEGITDSSLAQIISRLRNKIDKAIDRRHRYGYSASDTYLFNRFGMGYYLENARVIYADKANSASGSSKKDTNATHAVVGSTSRSETPLTTPFAPPIPPSTRLHLFLLQKRLTQRECQIAKMLIDGDAFKTIECIADDLNRKRSTVKKHLGSIYRKLGVNSRLQATRVILEEIYGGGAA